MKPWEEFLHASKTDIRRNEVNRGLAYEPDPKALTVDAVIEYVSGFGTQGVGAREVTAAVQRDERGVKRALATLVEDGRIRVEETLTRGPKASRRKVYRPLEGRSTVVSLDPDMQIWDRVERSEFEYGAGGGREVLPHPGVD